MAPTLQPVFSGSRLAERWFAHSERTQPLQPSEGSSLFTRFFAATESSTGHVELHARSAFSSHNMSLVSAIVIAGVLGGAMVLGFCE